MSNFKKFPLKKCKNFGITFAIILTILSVYDYFYLNSYYKVYFFFSFTFFIVSMLRPSLYKFAGFYWERLGFLLGIFFSPIILSIVYFLTIVPINLVIRILNIDLINKKISKGKESYWEIRKNKTINFKDQF